MAIPESALSASTVQSHSFDLLDERIRRWIWNEGWNELREVQERAIPALLAGQHDVILAAATASGKTEAAFFPILTRLLTDAPLTGLVIYISPLKALINDQWGRLSRLCDSLEIPVHPWHGDISATRKQKFFKNPVGVILITPESLESLFVNRGHGLGHQLAGLCFIVIDELHALIGTERGKQLQSLMRRLDVVVTRQAPRIGLSATLGDMQLAAEFLRPGAGAKVEVIVSKDSAQELKLIVKGYIDSPPRLSAKEVQVAEKEGRSVEREDVVCGGELEVGRALFDTLRGSNNLVFPNSRGKVELFADLLRRQCEQLGLPNEFWPHHGSLSKEIREETEVALKRGDRPATAICTTTLELGIDIGSVASVAQIGPPPSVASLRQRLGRSGRRGDAAVLRTYCIESPLGVNSPLSDQLREGLVQNIAIIQLLLAGWYEPPRTQGLHLSTLIQQLLSIIAQYGGVTASRARDILCAGGPFSAVSQPAFIELLRALGQRDILMQRDDGLLLHGGLGEKLVNHYTFYAAFVTEEEYRIVTQGHTLGSLPISQPLTEGTYIIFAGRRWRVTGVDSQQKVISVVPAPAGRPPLFGGGAGIVHDRVREEMRQIYLETKLPEFLDRTAGELLSEGRKSFGRHNLREERLVQRGADCWLFPWRGDVVHNTMVLLLNRKGFEATNEGISVVIPKVERNRLRNALQEVARETTLSAEELAASVKNKAREKWDWLLPDRLLDANFASDAIDVEAARQAITLLVHESSE